MRRSQLRRHGFYGGLPVGDVIVPPRAKHVQGLVKDEGERLDEFNENNLSQKEINERSKRRYSREQQVENDRRFGLEKERVIKDEIKGNTSRRRSKQKAELYSMGRTSPIAIANDMGGFERIEPPPGATQRTTDPTKAPSHPRPPAAQIDPNAFIKDR